ncbi:EI24 domain-containing protein [Azohydromonas lata]|uniref:EI24 domain-containing protein n=1 Tax=Azohydromonas lata TaxID=45677 RepID=UPI000A039842|nr:EI24 domain-containing protein [Azohydromonas lata]
MRPLRELLDAFWRAAAYCLHPRVVVLTLAPLLIAAALALGLGWLYWEGAVDGVRELLERWSLTAAVLGWLDSMGGQGLRAVIAPLLVVALAVPVLVVVSLLLVSTLSTPALTNLVARRRFPALQRRHGASFMLSVLWALGCSLLALFVLVLSVPLWLIPPLVLVLPPLVWGWLTYQLVAFDVLSDHASKEERRRILREQRWPLLAMGVISGYLSAAPSLLWAFGATVLILAPLLVVVSVWLYTLVFAFSSLWFAHFSLAALQRLRAQEAAAAAPSPPPGGEIIDMPLSVTPSPLQLPREPHA